MPISVKVVSEAEFAAWLQQAKAQAKGNSSDPNSSARDHASLVSQGPQKAGAEDEAQAILSKGTD